MPSVSIITPTYNRAHLLPRVWNSLCGQTEQNFQWIVVDDGSTDNTKEVVCDFNDPRIDYVCLPNNTGVNAARNRGEQEIKAEFVVYLDSDDEFFDATSLAEMMREIRETRPEIACVNFIHVDEYGQKVPHLEADRMEADYIDHVCEQKFWGDFFTIQRYDSLAISPWPPYRGFEGLRHWRIARQRPTLLINRVAGRVYRQKDNLTLPQSAILHAASMAKAANELIDEHKSAWLNHCPSQFGKYSFWLAMYLVLSGSSYLALPSLFSALRYGKWSIRIKAVLLFLACIFPLNMRKKLFLLQKNMRNRMAQNKG